MTTIKQRLLVATAVQLFFMPLAVDLMLPYLVIEAMFVFV